MKGFLGRLGWLGKGVMGVGGELRAQTFEEVSNVRLKV